MFVTAGAKWEDSVNASSCCKMPTVSRCNTGNGMDRDTVENPGNTVADDDCPL